MKKIFFDPTKDFELSIDPLILFKVGLALCVVIQSIGYLMDAELIFSPGGLLPDSLAVEYYQTTLYALGEGTERLLPILLISLATLSLFKRLQNGCFLLIAVLEIWLLRRSFIFTNSGDTALSYLMLVAAFLPSAKFGDRGKLIRLQSLLPLYTLSSIVYLVNLGLKLNSRWSSGQGLMDSIRHLELSRLPSWSQYPNTLLVMDWAAVLLVAFGVFVPWLSLENRRVRNGAVLAVCLYHVVANLFMRLSWLSLPFLILELSLWAPRSFRATRVPQERSRWQVRCAWVLVLLGFFGMKEIGDVAAFADKTIVPFGHNWNMFAPPPPATAKWNIEVKTVNEIKTVPLEESISGFEFSVFQHRYKFLNNLRRSEMVPVAEHFSRWICHHWRGERPTAIRLRLSLHVFQSDSDHQIEFPETRCNQ